MKENVPAWRHRKERESMSSCNINKRYTFEEFEAMPKQDGVNYELIDGIILMSPRPTVTHQKISLRLASALLNALKEKNCDVVQEIDLVLEGNNLIPDILVTCNEQFEGKRHEKPPLIVIEIVSPSSASRDFITKLQKYEQLGIKEYWIVVPEEKSIWVICFAQNSRNHYYSGQVISSVLPDLTIYLDEIFE